jgi:predicted nucleic acid-binding Zn ribbon protein
MIADANSDRLVRCTICGKRFPPFKEGHHLCSYKCRDAYNQRHKKPLEKLPRNCSHCGKSFVPNHRENQRYCNKECWQAAKAKEGRAARRVWWQAGRPMDVLEAEAAMDQMIEQLKHEANGSSSFKRRI